MGRTCAVISCLKTTQDKTVSLYRLPTNAVLAQKWKAFLAEANQIYKWKETKCMYVCSDHFHPQCKMVLPKGNDSIVKGSIPTLSEGKVIQSEDILTPSKSPCGSTEANNSESELNCGSNTQESFEDIQRKLRDTTVELEKTKQELCIREDLIKILRNKIRILSQKTFRHESRKRKLEDDSESGSKSRKVQKQNEVECESNPCMKLLSELAMRKKKSTLPFSNDIKDFAFQMHYYSPRAYDFARSTIPVLPDPSSFHRWTKSVQTTPGFLPTSFNYLKQRNSESTHQLLYALSLDEIHIRKQIVHSGDGFTGYVDNGDMATSDRSGKYATAALFVVATEINGTSKIPLGYILTSGIKADTLSQVIKNTIIKMDEVGATPISLVFDGLKVNFKAVEMLGACMDVLSPNFRPSIPHPCGKQDIAILLDVSHMFKLLRNFFKDFGTLVNGEGQDMKWDSIAALHRLQEEKGVRLANNLTSRHVFFKNQKMKTGLCVQTLSNSVSVALGVCRELNIPGFENTSALEEFLSTLDRLFDYLNSTRTGKGFKSALRPQDYEKLLVFFDRCKTMLLSLQRRMPSGELVKIHQTTRSTAIKGLIISMSSVLSMMRNHLLPPDSVLKYLPVYKTMQDLIETFFSSIRARFGYNNNPNAFQLQHALKGIVCMKTRGARNGNCVEQAEVSTKISPLSNLKQILDDEPPEVEYNAEDFTLPDISLCRMVSNVVAYIAGFVGKRLCARLKCYRCIIKLGAVGTEVPYIKNDLVLIENRDNGGLFYPSYSLIHACKIAEQIIRSKETDGLAGLSKSKVCKLIVKECIDKGYDVSLDCEVRIETLDNVNHNVSLLYEIAAEYAKVRFHYSAKKSTLAANPTTNRSSCTKFVHFKGN